MALVPQNLETHEGKLLASSRNPLVEKELQIRNPQLSVQGKWGGGVPLPHIPPPPPPHMVIVIVSLAYQSNWQGFLVKYPNIRGNEKVVTVSHQFKVSRFIIFMYIIA